MPRRSGAWGSHSSGMRVWVSPQGSHQPGRSACEVKGNPKQRAEDRAEGHLQPSKAQPCGLLRFAHSPSSSESLSGREAYWNPEDVTPAARVRGGPEQRQGLLAPQQAAQAPLQALVSPTDSLSSQPSLGTSRLQRAAPGHTLFWEAVHSQQPVSGRVERPASLMQAQDPLKGCPSPGASCGVG